MMKFFYFRILGDDVDPKEIEMAVKLPCRIFFKDEVVYYHNWPLRPQKTNYRIMIVDDRKDPESELSVGKISDYPKRYGFLAVNDRERKIRYCYLEDIPLDYFESEVKLQKYLKNNFPIGWD